MPMVYLLVFCIAVLFPLAGWLWEYVQAVARENCGGIGNGSAKCVVLKRGDRNNIFNGGKHANVSTNKERLPKRRLLRDARQ